MSKIKVSVVVPIYNVEEYLVECLDSIANQTLKEIEVLLIDDGSTDNSARIAKEYDEKYSNFHYYYKENGGLGNARNYAIPYVKGDYLIFIDSDDVVPPYAYKKMYDMAIRTGNDMIIGNVKRFNSISEFDSVLHRKFFDASYEKTLIYEKPELVYDTTSWNKLFKTSFYKKNNFQFPEKILYEDIPVTIPAHFKANSIGMVDDICYLWRVRDGVSKSITQNRTEKVNLDDRLKIMKMVNEFYQKNVEDSTALYMKDFKWLDIDLKIYINTFLDVDDDYLEFAITEISEFLKSVDEKAFKKIRSIDRLKYYFIKQKNKEKLLEVLRYQKTAFKSMKIRRIDGHYVADFPFDIPKDLSFMENELSNFNPVQSIQKIKWEGNKLLLKGYFYLPKLKRQNDFKCEATLRNIHTNQKINIDIKRTSSKEITEKYGWKFSLKNLKVSKYNYDECGFEISIDLKNGIDLNTLEGIYKIDIHYFNDIVDLVFPLSNNYKSSIKGNYVKYMTNKKVYIQFISDNDFELNFKTCELLKVNEKIDDLIVLKNTKLTELYLVNDNFGSQCIEKNDNSFIIKTDELPYGKNQIVTNDTSLLEHASLDNKPQYLYRKDYLCTVADDEMGRMSISKFKNVAFLRSMEKKNTTIELSVEVNKQMFNNNSIPMFVLKNTTFNYVKKLSMIKESDVGNCQNYLIKISLDDYDIIGNLASGNYQIYLEFDAVNQFPIVGYYNQFISFKNGQYSYNLHIDNSSKLVIVCHYQWNKKENTKEKRRIIRKYLYSFYRMFPIKKNIVVFESFWGNQYACNPKYFYEYLQREHPEYHCVWLLNDERIAIEGKGERVRKNSAKYYYYLAVGKYFVNNVNFHINYLKRKSQIEIQTMHGTPLKTLGLDVPGDFPDEKSIVEFKEKCSRWNYLVVQSDKAASITKSCYGFKKDYLYTGYPRTDKLFERNNLRDIELLKKQLGLPLDKKVILYAPTWRRKNYFEMHLDVNSMKEQLGEDYILLLRLHHYSVAGLKEDMLNEFVYNFSSYENIEDLYLVTDILITDYSSVMFDYSILKRPMLFFTYDLEEYRDNLRGFNFDFEKERPGPLLKTSKEVIESIINIDNVIDSNKTLYDNFLNTFTQYERGKASQEIFKKVFKK